VKVDSTHLAQIFERVSTATDRGDHVEALRLADGARRLAPEHPDAQLVYARALLNDGRAAAAAECLAGREDPESLVLRAEASQAAGRGDDAIRTCCLALTRFAVDSVPGLAALAGRLCRANPERFPGWMGLDSTLKLVGELTGVSAAIVNWCNASIGRISIRPDTSLEFSVDVPAHLEPGTLKVRAGDSDLLGSGLRWPLDFHHEGWVVLERRRLFGRVGLRWAPQPQLTVIVGPGRGERRIGLEPSSDHAVDRPFEIELHDLDLDRDTLEVMVMLPDGRLAPLVGSPLKLPGAEPWRVEPLPDYVTVPTPGRPARHPVNIVIPVFAGLKETLNCLRSVVATAPPSAVITVVDDMTPDAELRDALDNAARRGLFTLVRTGVNLGFPGAANRGLRLHRDRDVILLNADTEVFPGWVERLGAAAYSGEHIGTVTPFGESGSILSYASRPGAALSATDAARADGIARRVNATHVVDLPVGVGFCLYLRRACLNDAGEFDELGFGRGYGEENDLCLRARRRGWRHVAATDVFVRHVGGRSYGKERDTLSRRNELVLNYRYPGYTELVAEFSSRDPLRAARRAIDQQWLTEIAVKPVLLMSFELSGGVKRHVAERRAALEAEGHTVLLLRADTRAEPSMTPAVRIEALRFEYLGYAVPQELEELRALLRQLALTRIEIHHFLGFPGEILELVLSLRAPYRVFIHDYVWVCPRVTLLNGQGVYCREPAIDSCEACVRTHGSNLGEPLTVAQLRLRSGMVLGNAERVVVPAQDVRQRMVKYFPSIDPVVHPWEGPVARPRRPRRPRRAGPVRVALLGALGTQKGHAVLLECARDAARRDLALRFVVVGYSINDPPLWATGRVFVTGPYEESEVTALLDREQCDVAWFPSVGPETWCYALTHALAAGLPVVAFDLGAVAERVRASGSGVLLPLDTPAEQINAELLRIAAAERPSDAKPRPSDEKPTEDATPMDTNPGPETADPSAQLSATVQLLTLPEGLYAFTIQSGGADAPTALRLPALQVGLAPLRSAGTVEFLCGPKTVDRWLTAEGDVVTVRIAGGEASLLLTSVRSTTSGVLAIDVRRLDGAPVAVPAATAAPAAAAPPDVPSTERGLITLVHVPYLGDLTFVAGWAGKPMENLWIEAFSVTVEPPESKPVLEYCGVSEDGNVSAWLTEGELCGVRGRGVPLVAFALRVRAEAHGEYLCRYRGRFLSGAVIGPFDDGRFCRSEAPGDPLVALELSLEPIVAAPMVQYAG
jgi:GT2 family glycosyltransferase/glycosyltransferase involved in cell wall biosynthesis